MAEGVQYQVDSQVATITIDRPDRLNALDTRAIDLLSSLFERAGADSDVRVVVLTATGTRAFCVGADLKEMNHSESPPDASAPRARGMRLFDSIQHTYKPTIAALNGVALGVGCEIALACDLRIAASVATLGLPEAKLGLGSMFGSVILPRLIPRAVALQMLYTGESITAAQAQHWGLVNSVVDGVELQAHVRELARSIVANAPLSVSRFKHLAVKCAELPLAVALRMDVGPDPYTSQDRAEGVRAFVEKRPPRWRGE